MISTFIIKTSNMEVQHSNDTKGGFFHIEENGNQIGKMTYVWAGETKFIIDHTEVNPSHEGKGIGKLLVAAAVEYARANHFKIVPLCPYAKRVLTKTDEYQDILF